MDLGLVDGRECQVAYAGAYGWTTPTIHRPPNSSRLWPKAPTLATSSWTYARWLSSSWP
ncbi:hypothetical protein DFAR_4010009 [Desulfarculales bacterium]